MNNTSKKKCENLNVFCIYEVAVIRNLFLHEKFEFNKLTTLFSTREIHYNRFVPNVAKLNLSSLYQKVSI